MKKYVLSVITGAENAIDRDVIQSCLCQTCLDSINEICLSGNAPAEYAIVSFAERTIRPFARCYTWFLPVIMALTASLRTMVR